MTKKELRSLLDLFMCSDPYPCTGQEHVERLLDSESKKIGYSDWIEAYHTLEV